MTTMTVIATDSLRPDVSDPTLPNDTEVALLDDQGRIFLDPFFQEIGHADKDLGAVDAVYEFEKLLAPYVKSIVSAADKKLPEMPTMCPPRSTELWMM